MSVRLGAPCWRVNGVQKARNICISAFTHRAATLPLKTAHLPMTWNIGILIAGSLYWRTAPHREMWRDKFLRKDHAMSVKAPIRYGRLSQSRTYTMVYAPGSPMGQAKIVACRRNVS